MSLGEEVVDNFFFLSASWVSQPRVVGETENVHCLLFYLKVVSVTVTWFNVFKKS